jgi:hypothetical protein
MSGGGPWNKKAKLQADLSAPRILIEVKGEVDAG